MKDITNDADYTHAKRVCKDFEIKIQEQSDILLLADVFENFRNKLLEICKLDSVKFFSAT